MQEKLPTHPRTHPPLRDKLMHPDLARESQRERQGSISVLLMMMLWMMLLLLLCVSLMLVEVSALSAIFRVSEAHHRTHGYQWIVHPVQTEHRSDTAVTWSSQVLASFHNFHIPFTTRFSCAAQVRCAKYDESKSDEIHAGQVFI